MSVEQNHKSVDCVRKGASVAIRIEPGTESAKMVGRHFLETDELVSKITRTSIDILKESFRGDLTKEDWGLVIRLKKILGIA